MLYHPKHVVEAMGKIQAEIAKCRQPSALEFARRVLEIDPNHGPALIVMAGSLAATGDLVQAEEIAWQALAQQPCGYAAYHCLGTVLSLRDPDDPIARRMRHFGIWKLAMAEEILPEIVEFFRPSLEPDADAANPTSYLMVAAVEDARMKKNPDPPEIAERLLPYRLLNDLQRQAPYGVEAGTLGEIIEHASVCAPLFHGALREWARLPGPDPLDHDFARILIAILGEIGGPDIIGDLLETAQASIHSTFLHVHWAICRLAQRHPAAALRIFRDAIPAATTDLRCALAEQLNLLPEIAGVAAALTSLLDGFSAVAKEGHAHYLLAIVIDSLLRRGGAEHARALLNRSKPMLSREGRQHIHDALESGGRVIPLLVDEEIPDRSIEDVCLARYYMSDTAEEDEDLDEGGLWALVPPPAAKPKSLPPPKPGRNEPCWCGSGKKYKKCHLEADQKG